MSSITNGKTSSLAAIFFLCAFCIALAGPAGAFTETKTGEVNAQNKVFLSSKCLTEASCRLKNEMNQPGWSGISTNTSGCTLLSTEIFGWPEIAPSVIRGGTYECPLVTEDCSAVCKHRNIYNYEFAYSVLRDTGWKPISSSEVNKCNQIKLAFASGAEWFADLPRECERNASSFPYHEVGWGYGPPTQLVFCAGETDCLDKATEVALNADIFGRGAQKVPADFAAQTEKSLTSSSPYLKCTDGVCVSYTSGDFPLAATAPATSYFGQCRGYGATINTPEVAIPAVTSSATVNIKNRAPVPAVSFAKNPINVNEEIDVTCDIIDPDECSDKIIKVKWTCTDSNGISGNCSIWKANTGQWITGAYTQDIVSSEQNNPYRATSKFKASQTGNYAVTCEAWDNDNGTQSGSSGTGINGIAVVQVAGNCGADNFCNPNCNPPDPDCSHCGADGICVQGCNPVDPDCGVIAAKSGYCAVLSDSGGSSNQLCGKNQKIDYEAYSSGIDPATYKWKCSADAPVSETASSKITCNYSAAGSYLPALSIVDKSGAETSCVTQTSANVVGEGNGSCQLKIRPAGTGNDFTGKLTKIKAQDQVEAKIDKTCVSGGATKWTAGGGSIVNQTNGSALIRFDNLGESGIKAEITTPDGRTYDCGTVNVKVDEKVQWR